MGQPGCGLYGQHEQPHADIKFGSSEQLAQGGDRPLGVHVQGDVQCGAQWARNHQAPQADDVKGTEPYLMECAAAGCAQAGNAALGIHQEGHPVRLTGAPVDPGRRHPSRHHPLPDGGRHRVCSSARPQLRRSLHARHGVAVLVELRQHAVGRHGLQLRRRKQLSRRVEVQKLAG
ncbi:hypothetical protein GCM10009589_08220 [Arthrobacter pascens]